MNLTRELLHNWIKQIWHTVCVGVLVRFVSFVSHNPCLRMGFHKGEDWTWDILAGGSSLTARISETDSNPQISAFQSIIKGLLKYDLILERSEMIFSQTQINYV